MVQLVQERQNQAATADTSELSSFSLSELPVDQSRPPALMQGPYVPLSTSTPVHASPDNIQYTEAAEAESSFWQVIPNILQRSLYPSLATMGSSPSTASSPSIPLARRVINEIEEHQRTVLDIYAEGMDREMNTPPVLYSDEQQVEIKNTLTGSQLVETCAEVQDNTLQPESPEMVDTSAQQVDPTNIQNHDVKENAESVEVDASEQQVQAVNTDSQVEEDQQESEIPEDQTSQASQDDYYQFATDDDEQDDTIQFGNLVTQPFLSRSVKSTHYRGRLFKFYTNVTRILKSLSTTITCQCLFANSTNGSMVRCVFE